jgi:hypothetical protein
MLCLSRSFLTLVSRGGAAASVCFWLMHFVLFSAATGKLLKTKLREQFKDHVFSTDTSHRGEGETIRSSL